MRYVALVRSDWNEISICLKLSLRLEKFLLSLVLMLLIELIIVMSLVLEILIVSGLCRLNVVELLLPVESIVTKEKYLISTFLQD